MRVRLRPDQRHPGSYPPAIRQPGPGERGLWLVAGRVVGSSLDDPAYDLHHARSGRTRLLRRSRLRLVRTTRRPR